MEHTLAHGTEQASSVCVLSAIAHDEQVLPLGRLQQARLRALGKELRVHPDVRMVLAQSDEPVRQP